MTRITTNVLLALLILTGAATAAIAMPHEEIKIEDYRQAEVIEQVKNRRMAIVETTNTYAPQLQGATMGTIGPQGGDATVITGVMTAGTVRVNNLANLEAALNIAANGMTFLWIALGLYHLTKTIRRTNKTPDVVTLGLLNTVSFIAIGVLTPGAINWGIAAARDAALFN